MNVKTSLVALAACASIGLAACSTPAPAPAPTAVAPAASAADAQAALPASMPAEISVAEAKALQDSGAFMLDVRERSEWDEFHMPGATLIPLGELPGRVNELPKDKPIVVVCRSGNRSRAGRDVLQQAGLTNSTSMAGGMNDWRAQGLPTVTGP